MRPYPVHVPLSVESTIALSAMAADSWTALEVAGANAQLAGIDRVRITGGQTFVLQGGAVDVLPRWEAFTLSVSIVEPGGQQAMDSATDWRLIAEGAHFLERRHHLFVAGRRFPVPGWASEVASDLVVEDTIVIRDVGDRHLLVSADQDVPTTLVVATDWRQLDMRDIDIAYLRAVTY